MESSFSRSWFLSAAEVNAQGELSLPLLTQKIIDVATGHANSLGIGNPSMASLGCGWVLSRLAVEMEEYPQVNQTYSITTWVETWNRRFSVRNFTVNDASGNVIGHATSVWMVLNYRTRENAGLSHLSLAPDMISGAAVPIARPGRHAVTEAAQTDRTYTFRYCDLDFYRHVNTVRYIDLLLNTFTLECMDTHRVSRLDIAFMHEGHYGQTVRILKEEKGDSVVFALEGEAAPLLSAAVTLSRR